MLSISQPQYDALGQAMVNRLRSSLIDQFIADGQHVPGCHDLGIDGLASAVDVALVGALRFGWTRQLTVAGHVEMALTSGLGFLDDPMHPWPHPAPPWAEAPAELELRQWRRMHQAWLDGGADTTPAEWQLLTELTGELLHWTEPGSASAPLHLDAMVAARLQSGTRRLAGWHASARARSLAQAHTLAMRCGHPTPSGRAAMLLMMFAWGHAMGDDARHGWMVEQPMGRPGEPGSTDALRHMLSAARRRMEESHAGATTRLPRTRALADGRRWQWIGGRHDG